MDLDNMVDVNSNIWVAQSPDCPLVGFLVDSLVVDTFVVDQLVVGECVKDHLIVGNSEQRLFTVRLKRQ